MMGIGRTGGGRVPPEPQRLRSVSLTRGSVGPAVRSLQQRLVARGYLRPSEAATGPGVYGPRTEAAVSRLQAAHGLPVTGVADGPTLLALARAAPPPPSPRDEFRSPRHRTTEVELSVDATQPLPSLLRRETNPSIAVGPDAVTDPFLVIGKLP